MVKKNTLNLYYLVTTWAGFIIMFLLMWPNLLVYAGAFEFAGDTHGPNVMTHPVGYTGLGDELIVTVGISRHLQMRKPLRCRYRTLSTRGIT